MSITADLVPVGNEEGLPSEPFYRRFLLEVDGAVAVADGGPVDGDDGAALPTAVVRGETALPPDNLAHNDSSMVDDAGRKNIGEVRWLWINKVRLGRGGKFMFAATTGNAIPPSRFPGSKIRNPVDPHLLFSHPTPGRGFTTLQHKTCKLSPHFIRWCIYTCDDHPPSR